MSLSSSFEDGEDERLHLIDRTPLRYASVLSFRHIEAQACAPCTENEPAHHTVCESHRASLVRA
jgi:hypothetical protein